MSKIATTMPIRRALVQGRPGSRSRATTAMAPIVQSARTRPKSTPVRRVAASRYSRPCSLTSVTITSAIAPVAAEIMPGRPPVKAMTTAMQKEA